MTGVGDDELIEKMNKYLPKNNLRERLFLKNPAKVLNTIAKNKKDGE